MKKIKVIQISHSSDSYALGEGEKDLKKLVLNNWPARVSKQIKKFHPEIEIECWAPERKYKKEMQYYDSGVLFRFFPTTFSIRYALDLSIPMLKELAGEIKKSKEEGYKLIIHIHEIHNLHGLMIASLFGKEKLIVQHHGGYWPARHLIGAKKKKWFFLLFWLAQLWENLILKNIRLYYALSKEEINYLKKVAPNSQVRFQTMGIEDEYFEEIEKDKARKLLNLPLNKKIILFIGRIAEVKGMSYLLEAMKELKEVELKNIGFGPEEKRFKDYALKNNLKNVEFLGGVFGKKKMLYLHAADLLVLPSLKEGAPVVVMEALASNTPIVVSDVGGVSLMIKNRREGVIIKKRDSKAIVNGIHEVLNWKEKNIRKYANIYKWEKIIRDTVEDYNRKWLNKSE